jgi:hypothetical protein
MKCWIFDVDGTLADCSHRLHHIQTEPKNWDAFYAGCVHDAPFPHMFHVLRALTRYAPPVFVSGRRRSDIPNTKVWIGEQSGTYWHTSHFYFRKDGDHRHDVVVKKELLAELRGNGWEPIMVFEDRASVVEMWRAEGIPCAQVAKGDF